LALYQGRMGQKRIAHDSKDPEYRKTNPISFKKYIKWNNSTDNYTSSMKGISEELARLLSKEKISYLSKKRLSIFIQN